MSRQLQVVIIAGVSGVGKTTVGRLLASDLGWNFCEGDDFHPSGNLQKMTAGVPLSDEDRWPWLEQLKSVIDAAVREDRPTIVACSLLKESHRRYLNDDLGHVQAVFLTADERLVAERLNRRSSHYFPKDLLPSQLEAWEDPEEGLTVDASKDPIEIVAVIKKKLCLAG